jgi:eukaryotic-like serine/threonine-protein kinase
VRPDNWRQVETLFHAALQLKAEERAAYLAEACASDARLKEEVESLISSFEHGDSLLETPAFTLGLQVLQEEPATTQVGQSVGPYKILNLLGKGGMGEVYLAVDSQLGREVALKFLPASLTSDAALVRRFQQEARTAAAISHPNVAHIYETGIVAGQHYIAMEFVNGITLRQRLSEGRLDIEEAIHISLQIASALSAAHERATVHRDVKPENVMLDRDGRVKILDFGIAKLTRETASQVDGNAVSATGLTLKTDPGTMVGTIRYMSPEQLRSQPVDGRTDIWSLGAVLYEMVSSCAPFEGATPNDEIAMILQCEPGTLALPSGAATDEFQRIVWKALSKKLEHRYQRMNDFIRDLKHLQTMIEAERKSLPVPHSVVQGTEAVTSHQAMTIPGEQGRTKSGRPGVTQILSSAGYLISEIKQHKKGTFSATMLLALVATYIMVKAPSPPPLRRLEPASLEMKINPVTNAGSAVRAAVSRDGKLIAHVEEREARQVLFVTRTETGDTSALDVPREVNYQGLTFSADGGHLYYVRYEDSPSGQLYRVALADGATSKLMDGVDSPVSFAPGDGRFAFVRFEKKEGEYSLLVAEADGTGARVLAKRQGGSKFSLDGPAWSPDGKTVACAVGGWGSGHQMNLVGVDVETGRETIISDKQWFSVLQVAWLEDQSGLVACAAEQPMAPYQLWRIEYPGGDAVRITHDTADYGGVSITRDAGRLVSVQSNYISQVLVAPDGDSRRERAIAPKVGLSWGVGWTPDEKIVLSSMAGSDLNISLLDPATSELKRLTPRGDNYHPSVSADGRYVVFSSNRSGTFNLWRMNADGSEPVQLTFSDGNFYPSCSPDNAWVFYENQSDGKITLWKVPLGGGEAVRVNNEYSRMPAVSPDGQLIAVRYFIASSHLGIALLHAANGTPLKLLPIPIADWQRVQWTPDGKALTYIKNTDGVANIWRYDIESGQMKRLTDFGPGKIFSYAWSPDFRQLTSVRGAIVSDVVAISDFR